MGIKSLFTFTLLALTITFLPNISHAGMICNIVQVGSLPTEVLPANPNRTLLVFQNFSAMNIRCTDGTVQQPMVSGVDSDCPMGVGLVISHIDPPTFTGGVGGYPNMVISGSGTPVGPILCVHRVFNQFRSLLVCENQ